MQENIMEGNKTRADFIAGIKEFFDEVTAEGCEIVVPPSQMELTLDEQKKYACIALGAEVFPEEDKRIQDPNQLELAVTS